MLTSPVLMMPRRGRRRMGSREVTLKMETINKCKKSTGQKCDTTRDTHATTAKDKILRLCGERHFEILNSKQFERKGGAMTNHQKQIAGKLTRSNWRQKLANIGKNRAATCCYNAAARRPFCAFRQTILSVCSPPFGNATGCPDFHTMTRQNQRSCCDSHISP